MLRRPVNLDEASPLVREGGSVGLVHEGGGAAFGRLTPSRRLEIYSTTMRDFGRPDQAVPGYIESHVSRRRIDLDRGEVVLVPTFRLPT